ncbi:MAG: glycosyltransferase family 39 protein [Bryobacteraceae bacterium]
MNGAWPRVLIVAVVLAIRLPFLFHPIQGDDAFYLSAAEHAQVEPLHPHNFTITAQGMEIDMRGFPHPPGNAWILGAILAATGDIREPVYHGVYLIFSILAALAAFSIARRFCTRPLWATLLFVATPAFVINGTSLETDLPFTAFWLTAIALFLGAVEEGQAYRFGAAALAMAAAAQISYQAVVLIPVLGLWLWTRGERRAAAWLAVVTPALAIGLWQLYERSATGAAPSEVLTGHMATHSLQSLGNKARNAAALTVHLGWMQSPLLAPWGLVAIPVGAAAAYYDANPLFWVPMALGVATLFHYRRAGGLAGIWLYVYFAAALVIFFAGSARYLLPAALPLAILAVNRMRDRRGLLWAGLGTHLALGVALAASNQALWTFYRDNAAGWEKELDEHRSFVNAEWGLRHYAESAGAIPLRVTQTFRSGDRIVASTLGAPVRLPGGPRFTELSAAEMETPLRLIGMGSRSAYSSAAGGLRAFDIGTGAVDRVRLIVVNDAKPVLSYLPMNAPEADGQILSGVYGLEGNSWRWTARRAVVALKAPAEASYLEATFRIVEQSRGRMVTLSANGSPVAAERFERADQFTLRSSERVAGGGEAVTVTLAIEEGFRVDGDARELGLILTGIGFRD